MKKKEHRFEKGTKNSANFTRTVQVYPKVIKLVNDVNFSSLQFDQKRHDFR